jgi:hypothetical protein
MENCFVEERLRICKQCPKVKIVAGLLMQCQMCGCIMNAKARLEKSQCPIGKWPIREGKF